MKNILILLQARTSSSRLPAKSLLPVAGYPLAVLAAKRAGNTGLKVLVATSENSDDDLLNNTLKNNGIETYRGHLKNVLQRFIDATAHFSDTTIIVRLTGDNVLPDGNLLEELISHYKENDIAYLSMNGACSGVPYGLSAEVALLKYFREANLKSTTDFEREHVTPYIKNKYGNIIFDQYSSQGYSNLRCTIDNYDDYILLNKVFSKFKDPIKTPVSLLLKELEAVDYNISPSKSCDRLVLGSAQLGMEYGINNSSGLMEKKEAQDLIKFCIKSGISHIDIANNYGRSEEIIGEILEVGWREQIKLITKFQIPDSLSDKYRNSELSLILDNIILQSCIKLNVKFIDVLLFHRMKDFCLCPSFYLNYFSKKNNEGIIGELGISVQSPAELIDALCYPQISFIQLPFNLLDTRWASCIPKIEHEKKQRKLTIHSRSALLQGLLVSTDRAKWLRAGVKNSLEITNWLEMQCKKNNCNNVTELALRYALSFSWIDAIVVGFDNKRQAIEGIKYCLKGPLSDNSIKLIQGSKPHFSSLSLDPSTWKNK